MAVELDPGLPVQKVLRDLVALSAAPSVWVGQASQAIAADLADLLATSLSLDFAFVRLRDSDGSGAAEMALGTAPPAVLERLQQYLDGRRHLPDREIIPGACNGAQHGGCIVLPLGVNSEIGLVAAASDRPGFPSEIDQLLLSVAACHGATAFRMARLVEEHRRAEVALAASERQLREARDELEAKVLERTEELRRSEAYLTEAERLSHTGTWALSLKGERKIVYWSEESFRLYGLDPRQGVPTLAWRCQQIHPEDRSRASEEIERALLEKRDWALELRLLLADGTIKHLETIGHHVFSATGEPLEILGIQTDVTERKRAQEALRESEARFRDYAESASDWFWEMGPDYKFTLLTENAFGSDAARRIGTTCWDHALDLETESEKWRLVRATLESRKPFREFVYCTMGGHGSPMYVKASGKPVFDANGQFRGYRGTGADVTATVRAQAELQRSVHELKRSEFYLAEGQRLGHTGSWAFNPSGFFEYWSRELFEIYGLDPQKGAPTLERYLATIHPQDRDLMAETVKRMCEQGSGCDVKKRIIRPDGAVRYIRCVGVPVVEGGVFKRFLGTAMDVTEQEQLTQELQRRETYLAEAQRLSHTGNFGWKPDTDEVVWSDETYRIFECDRSVKPTLDSVVQRAHPQDRPDLRKVIADASRGATEFEHTHRLLMPDGRVKHVHAVAHPVQDTCGNREFVGAVTDITERKTAEEALRTSEAYLAEAERLSHTGTWALKDVDGETPEQGEKTPSYLSEEGYRIYGFDPRQGLPTLNAVWQRVHPDDRGRLYAEVQAALRERRDWACEYRLLLADGTVKHLEAVGHHMYSSRRAVLDAVLGIFVDVTERKRAQEERERLRQLESDLAHLNRVSMMGELAASLAHEVKQPIGAARNNARAAINFLGRSPPDLGEVREALGCIVGDADRAGEIIDRIRAHSKKAAPRKDRLDLNEAVTEVVELARSAIDKEKVSLRMHLADELSAVQGDRVQLQQVILNLVLNAIEAMSAVDGPRELSISTEPDGKGVLVAVRDSGPGIDPTHLERVFEAFYTTKPSGVGMGLSICRSLINAQGGRLWAGLNKPRGAVFQFTLPGAA